jgi:hypothetical protein
MLILAGAVAYAVELDRLQAHAVESERRRPKARRRAKLSIAGHLAIMVIVGVLLAHTAASVHPGSRPSIMCGAVAPSEDLFHLPMRSPDAARQQVELWASCDSRFVDRARTAIKWDAALILAVFASLLLAVLTTWKFQPWRVAARLGLALATAYAIADGAEDVALWQLLGNVHRAPPWWLAWASAVKFGAVLSAAPLFVVSIGRVVGDWLLARDGDAWMIEWETLTASRMCADKYKENKGQWRQPRWFERPWLWVRSRLCPAGKIPKRTAPWGPVLKSEPPGALQQSNELRDKADLGICCSGGGIRSAAFNLGALQALQENTDDDGKGEVDRANWLSAVSGGSYIAAAWVAARSRPGHEKAWSRRSPEEDHLRRHSSYLAPGVGGKLWALGRFFVSFTLNGLLVTLTLGALAMPLGWSIQKFERNRPSAGELRLPEGGCLRMPDGSTAAVLPESRLQFGRDQVVPVDTSALLLDGAGQATIDRSRVPARDTGTSGTGGVACPQAAVVNDRDHVVRASVKRGTEVPVKLLPGSPLGIEAVAIGGCRSIPGARAEAPLECKRESATSFGTDGTAVLLSAPGLALRTARPAIISKDGTLSDACGSRPCVQFRRPPPLSLLLYGIAGIGLALGLATVTARARASVSQTAERWTRLFLILSLTALGLIVALPALTIWAQEGRGTLHDHVIGGEVAGAGAVLFALLAHLAPYLVGAGAGATARPVSKLGKTAKKVTAGLRRGLIRFVATVVGPLIVVATTIGFSSYAAEQRLLPTQFRAWLAIVGLLLVIGSAADLNEWCLHPFYRDRLRSAFATEPRTGEVRDDPLTTVPVQPRLLVCAAVNLADDRVTAPGRPVASWVFEGPGPLDGAKAQPACMGSPAMRQAPVPGAPSSKLENGMLDLSELPPSLRHLGSTWSAVAVSGAAFSPSMGKMTRPERFLFALGNLRLGVWYPNPRFLAQPEKRYWYDTHHPQPWYLAKEALGRHRANDRWLYLSDGGHYENLGLVELLRRGCREIFCFDAAGDDADTFGTLADAMRLAREELNVEINIDPRTMRPGAAGYSPYGVCAGTVRFEGDGDEPSGWLVVAKLCVPATAPFDIVDLARSLPSFPANPTADQLYTDQKLEAYRALGHHLGEQALRLARDIRRHRYPSLSHAVATANRGLVGPEVVPPHRHQIVDVRVPVGNFE